MKKFLESSDDSDGEETAINSVVITEEEHRVLKSVEHNGPNKLCKLNGNNTGCLMKRLQSAMKLSSMYMGRNLATVSDIIHF